MTLKQKLYAGSIIAAILLIGIGGTWTWSSYQIGKLERAVESAKTEAENKSATADEMEKQSAGYAAKTEYLEKKLAEIQAIARRHDEELEKLSTDTNSARNDVERAKRVRTIAATADELCAKLAELGHGCR